MSRQKNGRNARKPIHFIFRTHLEKDPVLKNARKYLNKKTTWLYEDSTGSPPLTRDMFEGMDFNRVSPELRAKSKTFLNAFRRGIRVVPGEFFRSPAEIARFSALQQSLEEAAEIAARTRAIGDIKRLMVLDALEYRFRHELIKRTIQNTKLPLVATYGPAHSVLSKELRELGIESSREIKPWVFSWSDIVIRKLLTGKQPTDLEYKKAFISRFLAESFSQRGLLQKESDSQLYSALDAALFNKLDNPEQIVSV